MANSTPSAVEMNALVFLFLQESGFDNAASTFAREAELDKYSIDWSRVPSQALKSFVEEAIRRASNEQSRPPITSTRSNSQNSSLRVSLLEIRRYLMHEISLRGNVESNSNHADDPRAEGESEMRTDEVDQKREAGGMEEQSFIVNEPELHKCAWNPVFPILITGSTGPDARLWCFPVVNVDDKELKTTDALTESILLRNEGKQIDDVLSLDWNPQGNVLATGAHNGSMRLWTKTGRLMQTFQFHKSPVSVLKWSKKGKFLLSGCLDGKGTVLDPVTKSKTGFGYEQQSIPIMDSDWLDDWTFATCAADKMFTWCVSRGSPRQVCQDHKDDVNCVRFHPTSKTLISTCSDDKTAKIWDARKGNVLRTLGGAEGHTAQVSKLQWSPQANEKNILATCSFDNTVKLWDVTTTNCMHTMKGHISAVFTLDYSPNGQFIASGSQDGTMVVWSAKDGTMLHQYRRDGSVYDLSWSLDGMRLSAVFNSGILLVVDIRKMVSSTCATGRGAMGLS